MKHLRESYTGTMVTCTTCGRRKAPRGRSAPMEMHLCSSQECDGYDQSPRPGSLWPGESEEEFGYWVNEGFGDSSNFDRIFAVNFLAVRVMGWENWVIGGVGQRWSAPKECWKRQDGAIIEQNKWNPLDSLDIVAKLRASLPENLREEFLDELDALVGGPGRFDQGDVWDLLNASPSLQSVAILKVMGFFKPVTLTEPGA